MGHFLDKINLKDKSKFRQLQN